MKTALTKLDIISKIAAVEYVFLSDRKTTLCQLTLVNGFTVLGYSSCASPDNFDVSKGQTVAYNNAVNNIWELEGYLLMQRIYEAKLQNIETPPDPAMADQIPLYDGEE